MSLGQHDHQVHKYVNSIQHIEAVQIVRHALLPVQEKEEDELDSLLAA